MSSSIEGVVVAAALFSAFLHAAWNAGVKAAADPQGAMAAQVVTSGLIAVPLLFFVPTPPLAAVPWLAGSAVFNLLTFLALLRGYASGGGFGFVYPLARASSPLLVLFLARALQNESVGPFGSIGIALVSAGIALFALGEGRRNSSALIYALTAGACSAAYALCDGNGARVSESALGYGLTVTVINAIVFGTLHRVRSGISPVTAVRSHPGMATAGAGAATLSYFLILWVWRHVPIAIGAALRDTSVVFAALIATRLGERLTPLRIAAIALATAGACLIRFA